MSDNPRVKSWEIAAQFAVDAPKEHTLWNPDAQPDEMPFVHISAETFWRGRRDAGVITVKLANGQTFEAIVTETTGESK